jgi:NitT/TauT family transport system substrate-binding protein
MSLNRAQAIASIAGGIAGPVVLASAARAQTQPLRIAYIPTENCAQVFYAQEQGYFVKAGLEVHLEPINFSAAIASAVLSDAIDIGNISTLTITVAHSKHIPLVYIAGGNAFVMTKGIPDAGILVAANSPIKTARDLNGKTFGCSGLGSFGEFIPRAWVDANGGDSTTMKFVEFPNAQLPVAVSSGRADAAFVSPPAFGKALKENCRMLAVASDAVANEFMGSGWFCTQAWGSAHPAAIAAFTSALHAATVWARANPDKAVDILVKYLKLEPAVLAAIERVTFLDRLETRFLQPPINVVARYSKFPPFPAEELIYSPPRG